MGKIISLKEFLENLDFLVQEAKKGKIFVYPTDTVYGIGGVFPDTLEKVFEIKKRPKNKKVSIIYSLRSDERSRWGQMRLENLIGYLKESVELVWREVLELNFDTDKLLRTLVKLWTDWRGFTLVGKMKDSFFESLNDFAKEIYSDRTLGVRILNSDFQLFVNRLWLPFITTSANLSGQNVIKKIQDLPGEIKENVDWIVDVGSLGGNPSVLVRLLNWKVELVERN